jgi:DNA processing protein
LAHFCGTGCKRGLGRIMQPEHAVQAEAWVLLNASGLSPRRQMALLEAFDTPEAIFAASSEQLSQVEGITAVHVGKLRDAEAGVAASVILNKLADLNVVILTIRDESYPKLLREIDDPPPMLFVRGALERRDELAVALVGTRRRTSYGQMVAAKLAAELVRRGFTIVSGLAQGIDGDAHRGALEAGGRTIGVLACGIDVNYPSAHAQLKDEIAASGAVVTELALVVVGPRRRAGP